MREEKLRKVQRAFQIRFYFALCFTIVAFLLLVFAILTPLNDFVFSVVSIAWIATGVFCMIYTYNRGFSEEARENIIGVNGSCELNFDDKIRRIEKLKGDGLISEDEYITKRNEVLSDKW